MYTFDSDWNESVFSTRFPSCLSVNISISDPAFELSVDGKLNETTSLGLFGKEKVPGEKGLKLLKLNTSQLWDLYSGRCKCCGFFTSSPFSRMLVIVPTD